MGLIVWNKKFGATFKLDVTNGSNEIMKLTLFLFGIITCHLLYMICKNVHIFIFCQITSREDILEITQARFWELVPGQVVGSLSLAVVLTMSSIISNIVMHLQ